MGVITIEVPQNLTEAHTVDSVDIGAQLIKNVRAAGQKKKKTGFGSLVGKCDDGFKSCEQIAVNARRNSNGGEAKVDDGLDAALNSFVGM